MERVRRIRARLARREPAERLAATGARAARPPIPGLQEAGYLTHENVFDLTECPKRLLVIGGGPTGCELAQASPASDRGSPWRRTTRCSSATRSETQRSSCPMPWRATGSTASGSKQREWPTTAYDPSHGITVDYFMRTTNPHIFAAGDVFPNIENAAGHSVVANALFRGLQRLIAEIIPWCTFTDHRWR